MLWGSSDYQCVPKPTKCSNQLAYVEFSGQSISTFKKYTPADCCAKCATTTGCKGYTFVAATTAVGTCHLKSDLSNKVLRTGYISAVLN